jgi:hypothetical protein
LSVRNCFKCFNSPRVFDIKGIHYISCRECDFVSADFDKDECSRKWNERASMESLLSAVTHPGELKVSKFI